ncbi:MAG: sulfurtransferase [Dehalococcoidia bacterium]
MAETSWLKDNLSDAKLAIVDVRAKERYDAGHIPGAVWYDPAKLKDPDDKLYVIRDTLFTEQMSKLGVTNAKTVVAYDDNAGLSSTRLWWVLWYYGHNAAMVLNGGFPKWEKESLAVTKDAPKVEPASFKTAINENVLCAIDVVKKESAATDSSTVILDVRSPAEFTGADVRAAKGGHIPRSVNLDWTRSMTEADPKVWKSAPELRRQFEQVGIKPGSQVITYCQTGVRAAHSLFTLRLVGIDGTRNYDGSWQEWGNNKDTPVSR